MAALLRTVSLTVALIVHAVAAPVFFTLIARRYFDARGPRDPMPTAVVWTALVAILDLVAAGVVQQGFEMFGSITGTWLPFALIFLATWITGMVKSMVPSEGAAAGPSPGQDRRS
jgi:hypothetical protein